MKDTIRLTFWKQPTRLDSERGSVYLARMTNIPQDRSDRLDVPATLETGARRVPLVMLRPGTMRYPWGVERTDAATLQDPDFLRRIPGIPIKLGRDLEHHPGKPVRVGKDDGTPKIGTVLSARWDADENAIVGEGVLDEPAGLQALALGVKGLSLKYRVEVTPTDAADRADGAEYRRKRLYDPEHLLMTTNPRGGSGTSVRTDGGEMDPEIAKALEGITGALAKLSERMDAAEKPNGKEADDSVRADTAGDWRVVLDAAKVAEVKIDDGAKLADARKAVAKKLIGDRADSLGDEALAVAIQLASSRPDSNGGQTFAAWRGTSGQPNPDRQDAADKTPATRKIGGI